MNRDKWDKIKRVLVKQDRTLFKLNGSTLYVYSFLFFPFLLNIK